MTRLSPGEPIRVVVVDDSVLMRTMLRSALESEGDIKVVGDAREPFEARSVIKATDPHVITLDVEMPGMSGLEFLDKIMKLRPTPVVMVSSLTSEGAEATLIALEAGAVDFAAKPAGNAGMREFGDMVRRKVRNAARAQIRRAGPRPTPAAGAPAPRPAGIVKLVGLSGSSSALIAIGASTGGVGAIGAIVSRLPKGLPPITCVVHMPDKYTGRFAQRLAAQTGHDVAEAQDGETLRAGAIRIAPGGRHLEVERRSDRVVTRVSDGGLVSGHKPSVDVNFRSVAKHFGDRAVGVILTGMGRDGADGLLEMRKAGAYCLGEAESSCVVYGMPKAARQIGAVHEEHDLDHLPERIVECAARTPVRA